MAERRNVFSRSARAWSNIAVTVALLGAFACKKAPPPPKNEFEAFERKNAEEVAVLAAAMRKQGRHVDDKDVVTTYPPPFVGPSGLFINRKLVATLPEIEARHDELAKAVAENAKMLPSVGYTASMTFDLDKEPASVAIAVLRLFAGRETSFSVVGSDPEIPAKASRLLCNANIHTSVSGDRDRPQLSVLVDKTDTWVGLSVVNEYQQIPHKPDGIDVDKLHTVLREHAASALFEGRNEAELAASGGTSAEVIAAFTELCNAGFNSIAVVPREQLSANPQI
jgi:hypothetical protein